MELLILLALFKSSCFHSNEKQACNIAVFNSHRVKLINFF